MKFPLKFKRHKKLQTSLPHHFHGSPLLFFAWVVIFSAILDFDASIVFPSILLVVRGWPFSVSFIWCLSFIVFYAASSLPFNHPLLTETFVCRISWNSTPKSSSSSSKSDGKNKHQQRHHQQKQSPQHNYGIFNKWKYPPPLRHTSPSHPAEKLQNSMKIKQIQSSDLLFSFCLCFPPFLCASASVYVCKCMQCVRASASE